MGRKLKYKTYDEQLDAKGVGDENITSEIKNKLMKNGCEDITKKKRKYLIKIIDDKKVWYKECPICHREQFYSSISAMSWAATHNKICVSCKNSGINNPFYGRKHTKKHKQYMSNEQLSKCSYRYKKFGKNPDKIHKLCKHCDGSFDVVQSQVIRKYCCYDCALKDNFGFEVGKMTTPEKLFETFLIKNNIKYKYSYPLGGKLYDFYIEDKNLLVEIDGIYWHGKNKKYSELDNIQKKIYSNDRKKDLLAKKYKIPLIRLWEDEINDKKCTKIYTSTEKII